MAAATTGKSFSKKWFFHFFPSLLSHAKSHTDLRWDETSEREIFMVFCIYAMSLLRCCVNGDGSGRQKVTISALLMHMKCVVNTTAWNHFWLAMSEDKSSNCWIFVDFRGIFCSEFNKLTSIINSSHCVARSQSFIAKKKLSSNIYWVCVRKCLNKSCS